MGDESGGSGEWRAEQTVFKTDPTLCLFVFSLRFPLCLFLSASGSAYMYVCVCVLPKSQRGPACEEALSNGTLLTHRIIHVCMFICSIFTRSTV
jgi:hypothetical protein